MQASHYEHWDTVRLFALEYQKHDFDYYPRGRVVYNTKNDTFFVWLDKCISPKYKDLICKSFNLSGKNVVFGNDEHYQCAGCNEDYVDIGGI